MFRPRRYSQSSSLIYTLLVIFILPLYGCNQSSDSSSSTTDSTTDTTDSGTTSDTGSVNTGTPDDSRRPDAADPQPAGEYDGTYTVTFIADGVQAAIGSLVIVNSLFDGELITIYNEIYPISGRIDSDGNFIFYPIEGNLGTEVDAEGYIDEGLVSGSYSADGREGVFTGSMGSNPFQYNAVTDFDGTYEAAFSAIADAEGNTIELASTVFTIEDGKFKTSVTTVADSHFEIAGFVTSDGTVVISMMTGYSEIDELQAEGNIDHETFEIQGMYRIGTFAGVVNGKISD